MEIVKETTVFQGRKVEKEVITLDGLRFIRYPNATTLASKNYFRYAITRDKKYRLIELHRYIWGRVHGPIPKGHHVHHKDENPLNNDISNLECLPQADHQRKHALSWHARRRDVTVAPI